MAATSTPSITSLVSELRDHYPDLELKISDDLSWDPIEQVVYYSTDSTTSDLLHEIGHALLGHRTFNRDITLLEMEREAWSKAREIASSLDLTIDEDVAETHLDTYREWLHARSTCPHCGETGIEISPRLYNCLSCDTKWQVNDARRCALRRRIIK